MNEKYAYMILLLQAIIGLIGIYFISVNNFTLGGAMIIAVFGLEIIDAFL